jgi:hypothetical protein
MSENYYYRLACKLCIVLLILAVTVGLGSEVATTPDGALICLLIAIYLEGK